MPHYFALPVAVLSMASAQTGPAPHALDPSRIQRLLEGDQAGQAKVLEGVTANNAAALALVDEYMDLYYGALYWPKDLLMRSDGRTREFLTNCMRFNRQFKRKAPDQYSAGEAVQLLDQAERITQFSRRSVKLAATAQNSAWYLAQTLQARAAGTLEAHLETSRREGDEAFAQGRWDQAADLYRSFTPPLETIRAEVQAAQLPAHPCRPAVLDRVVKDLAGQMQARGQALRDIYQARLASLALRGEDARACNGALPPDPEGQLSLLGRCSAILDDPARLAMTRVPAAELAARLRSALAVTLRGLPTVPWIQPALPALPPLDTVAHCDQAGQAWTTALRATQDFLDRAAALAPIGRDLPARAEALGLLGPADRQALEASVASLVQARAFAAEGRMFLEALPARREALDQSARQAIIDAPRLRAIEWLKAGTYGSGKSRTTLKAGYHANPTRPKDIMGAGFTELYPDTVVLADGPNPTGPDAVLILGENGGGSAVGMVLHAVRLQRGVVQDLGATYLGDRTRVKVMTIHKDLVTVDMLVHGDNDGLCCPSVPLVRAFRLKGSALVPQASAEEVEEIFDALHGALTNHAALAITMATDRNAMLAYRELNARLKEAKAAENRARIRMRQFALASDARFRERVRAQIAQYQQVTDQIGLGFGSLGAGQQRAYLVIGQVKSRLQGLIGR